MKTPDVILKCDTVIPFLKVVSNSTRLRILCILMEGECRVGQIQEMLGAKQSYVSQQLKYLKTRGFLDSRREGTQIYYQLVDDKFPQVYNMLRSIFKDTSGKASSR